MYRPEFENLTSDIEEIISEKKLRVEGSSGSSNTKIITVLRVSSLNGQTNLFYSDSKNKTYV